MLRFISNAFAKHGNSLRQFMMYTAIAGLAAIIELSLLYLLTSVIGIYYIISVIIAYPVAVATNFLLNKFINFKNRSRKVMKQVTIFIMINLGGLGLTVFIMYLLVEYLNIWYLLARVMCYAVTLLYSFTLHKHVTFRI